MAEREVRTEAAVAMVAPPAHLLTPLLHLLVAGLRGGGEVALSRCDVQWRRWGKRPAWRCPVWRCEREK
uniref:Uncharacterized protein n=1 Tax=Oryza sativa subsp. japonica TaxID=39947 RepID=Q6K780_ORYSJ|nr:hypothetical protein [Oryza sativa Japonica Group]